MQEENSLCLITYQAYKSQYPEKDYVAIPIENSKPLITCLVYRKPEPNKVDSIYQALIDTAVEITETL